MKVSVKMKILPVVNSYKSPPVQAGKAPAFCAAPESKVINQILGKKSAQWVLKFASNNPFGFNVLALAIASMIFRPITVLALPGQKKDDKQYLAVKSVVASVVANAGRLLFILPLGLLIKHAGNKAKKNPQPRFPIIDTKEFNAFNFAINNGFAFFLAIGTAAVMTKAIPRVMAKILPPPEQNKKIETEQKNKETSDKKGGTL